jgi:hypothetical protein
MGVMPAVHLAADLQHSHRSEAVTTDRTASAAPVSI